MSNSPSLQSPGATEEKQGQIAVTKRRGVQLTSGCPPMSAKGRAMRCRPARVSITVWMRTRREGIITWTWLVSRTTPPDLMESPLPRRLMFAAPRARVRAAHAPRNQKPKWFTSGAHKSSATATTQQSLEARAHSSSNLPKEPIREAEGITGAAEVANPLNVTATTRLCKACCTVATQQDMGVKMCTTCRTKPNPPATTSTLCNTVTANA